MKKVALAVARRRLKAAGLSARKIAFDLRGVEGGGPGHVILRLSKEEGRYAV
ncbi:MAG TPA: hypothetical protein VF762_02420 [Blastocatellia bacterium]|jgi:hypothetical protein